MEGKCLRRHLCTGPVPSQPSPQDIKEWPGGWASPSRLQTPHRDNCGGYFATVPRSASTRKAAGARPPPAPCTARSWQPTTLCSGAGPGLAPVRVAPPSSLKLGLIAASAASPGLGLGTCCQVFWGLGPWNRPKPGRCRPAPLLRGMHCKTPLPEVEPPDATRPPSVLASFRRATRSVFVRAKGK